MSRTIQLLLSTSPTARRMCFAMVRCKRGSSVCLASASFTDTTRIGRSGCPSARRSLAPSRLSFSIWGSIMLDEPRSSRLKDICSALVGVTFASNVLRRCDWMSPMEWHAESSAAVGTAWLKLKLARKSAIAATNQGLLYRLNASSPNV